MLFRQLFDARTSTYTYLLADSSTGSALLIDPVQENFERDQKLLRELGLSLRYTVETHVHADHVTSADRFRESCNSQTVAPKRGGPSCANLQVDHGDHIEMDAITLEVRSTPGHTDGCTSYVLRRPGAEPDMVFTGDALMIRGCGRTDFQAGCAATLYRSVHEQLFSLADDTIVYPGHDYKGMMRSTIGEEKQHNPRLGQGRSLQEFEQIMAELKLKLPKQIVRALPANLACGKEGPSPFAAAQGVALVEPGWVQQNRGLVKLLDVRATQEASGELAMIEGAQLIPSETLAAAAQSWDKDLPLVLVCRSGARSEKAAIMLKEMGFDRVASMRGGMMAYAQL